VRHPDWGGGVSLAVRGRVRKGAGGSGAKDATARQRDQRRGEWDEVFDAIRRCHEVLHAMGAPRIATTIRLGTRVDREQTMEYKMRSVEGKLGGEPDDAESLP
jgi:hypothetical protein